MIENQLKKHALRLRDVRYVLHTHLHIDHAGKDDLFPMNTTVVISRVLPHPGAVSWLWWPRMPGCGFIRNRCREASRKTAMPGCFLATRGRLLENERNFPNPKRFRC
jgi:glyoxylase-like metal-dependent hydrolase (beta-lactamase superfamily II)